MRTFFIVLFTLLSIFPSYANVRELQEKVLYPIVMVKTYGSSGSGVVIWSGETPTPSKRHDTLIITNWHVVKNELGEVDGVKKPGRVVVNIPEYINGSEFIGTKERPGTVIGSSQEADLALILLDDHSTQFKTVDIAPLHKRLDIGEEVLSVGAGLGNVPFITTGILNVQFRQFGPFKALMSTAPIINGNSGGGLFLKSTNQLIGINTFIGSKVEPVNGGDTYQTVEIPMPHMAWAVPLEVLYAFLEPVKFVLTPKPTKVKTTESSKVEG